MDTEENMCLLSLKAAEYYYPCVELWWILSLCEPEQVERMNATELFIYYLLKQKWVILQKN